MERRRANVVYKYFDLTDEFLRIRVLDPEVESGQLHPGAAGNKSAYRRAILSSCVIDWHQAVQERLERSCPCEREAAEELLYQICVEVNPRFEIHQIALPAGEGEPAQRARRQPEGAGNPAQQRRRWRRRARTIERELGRKIHGQDKAISRLAHAIRKHAAGLGHESGLIASYLLVGSTGVGKTALCKALAEALFDDQGNFVRIDCSEYAMSHEYSKLIGAPPGYIGHEEGGMLTEVLARASESIVLFDEIEKAHPKIHQLLLQVLDEGHLSDSRGRQVPLRDCLVLMTSNLGTAELIDATESLGFAPGERRLRHSERHGIVHKALRRTFTPEFLARLDEVLLFRDLDEEDCRCIAARQIELLRVKLRRLGLGLRVSRAVSAWIARQAYSPRHGAREIARVLAREVEDPLSERLLEPPSPPPSAVHLSIVADRLRITLHPAPAALSV